jgi:hypothetical protein
MEWLFILINLALVLWAVYNVVRSDRGMREKLLWLALIAVVPVFGFVVWLVVGPRARPGSATA